MKSSFLALLLAAFLATPAFAQAAPGPISYLAVAVVYKAGKLIGAQILGQAPSMIECMKAAQGTMGRFNEDPSSHPPDVAINVACIPVPPAPAPVARDPVPQSHNPDGLNPEAFQLTAAN